MTDMNMYMVPNPGMPGCPPGLEYLTQVMDIPVATRGRNLSFSFNCFGMKCHE